MLWSARSQIGNWRPFCAVRFRARRHGSGSCKRVLALASERAYDEHAFDEHAFAEHAYAERPYAEHAFEPAGRERSERIRGPPTHPHPP